MRNEPTEDLLVIIAMQKDEPEAARQAFHEFHRRFKDYVWNISVILSKKLTDPNRNRIAQDIFNDTFLDVFHNYRSEGYFDSKECNNIEKGVKAWLGGIASNHLKRMIDSVKASARMSYLDAFPDRPFFDDDNPLEETVESPRILILQRALEHLSDKEREILLIAIQFEEQGRLPKEMKRSLCEAYGLAPDSLRQIKKRAKEKIENYMQEHGYLIEKKSKSNVR